MEYRFQVGSDIIRAGLGVELTDAEGMVFAEVFRCDADRSLKLALFRDGLPFLQVERLLHRARVFEDGTPLPNPPERDG